MDARTSSLMARAGSQGAHSLRQELQENAQVRLEPSLIVESKSSKTETSDPRSHKGLHFLEIM